MADANKRILLVEDDLFVRELYEHVLAESGYTVVQAVDGAEGLKLAQENIDLILLDIMLPQMNGIDVLKKLKSDDKTKAIPVILLTNLGQDKIIKDAFASGASGYLLKMSTSPYQVNDYVKQFLDDPTLKLNSQ